MPPVDSGGAWLVCMASFVIQFLVYGLSNAYSTMFIAFLQEFQQSQAATAWIGSLVLGLNFFLGPFTTALCDRFGCRVVACIGSFFLFAGLVSTSFVNSFDLLFLSYGMCIGLASSLCYTSSVIILTKYFKRHLSLATGIGMAGSGFGTMTITSTVSLLTAKYGWRFALRYLASTSVIVFLCGLSFVPLEKTSNVKLINKEKQLASSGPEKPLKALAGVLFDSAVWRNKAFVTWVSAIALVFFGDFVPCFFIVRLATDYGTSLADASMLPGYLSICQSLGKLLFGKLADLKGVNRLFLYQMVLLVQGVGTTLCPLITTYWGLVCFTVLFGLTDGGFALMLGLGTYDVAGPRMMSKAFGGMSMVVSIPLMAGPVVTGLMYDFFKTYTAAFVLAGGTTTAGVCLMFLIPWLSTNGSTEKQENIQYPGSTLSETSRGRKKMDNSTDGSLRTINRNSYIKALDASHIRPNSLLLASLSSLLSLPTQKVGDQESLDESLYKETPSSSLHLTKRETLALKDERSNCYMNTCTSQHSSTTDETHCDREEATSSGIGSGSQTSLLSQTSSSDVSTSSQLSIESIDSVATKNGKSFALSGLRLSNSESLVAHQIDLCSIEMENILEGRTREIHCDSISDTPSLKGSLYIMETFVNTLNSSHDRHKVTRSIYAASETKV